MPRKKACTKRPYPTREAAQKAIDALVRRYGPITYRKPYRCARCKAWHLTGTPPDGPARVRR